MPSHLPSGREQNLRNLAIDAATNPIGSFFAFYDPLLKLTQQNKDKVSSAELHKVYQAIFSNPWLDVFLWFQPGKNQWITETHDWATMRLAYLRGDMKTEQAFNSIQESNSEKDIAFLAEKTSSFWAQLLFPSSLYNALCYKDSQLGGGFRVYHEVAAVTQSTSLYSQFLCYFFPSLTYMSLTPMAKKYEEVRNKGQAEKLLSATTSLAQEIMKALENNALFIDGLVSELRDATGDDLRTSNSLHDLDENVNKNRANNTAYPVSKRELIDLTQTTKENQDTDLHTETISFDDRNNAGMW